MKLIGNLIAGVIVLAVIAIGGLAYWAKQPIIEAGRPPIAFSIEAGAGGRVLAKQIAKAGVPLNPDLFALLARAVGKSGKMKAGSYELKPGTTPLKLVDQLVRGEFAQESLAIIEGWTFRQMREAVAQHPGLKHDTVDMSERELLEKAAPGFKIAEGLFFPDTYMFAKGSSELQVYKQAHTALIRRLNEAWAKRDMSLPYKTPYDALIMASIVEKETGRRSERHTEVFIDATSTPCA